MQSNLHLRHAEVAAPQFQYASCGKNGRYISILKHVSGLEGIVVQPCSAPFDTYLYLYATTTITDPTGVLYPY